MYAKVIFHIKVTKALPVSSKTWCSIWREYGGRGCIGARSTPKSRNANRMATGRCRGNVSTEVGIHGEYSGRGNTHSMEQFERPEQSRPLSIPLSYGTVSAVAAAVVDGKSS